MMISTRGRYALRVMIDLAQNSEGNYIAMKEVAARQEVSLKYLERILPLLVKAGLVEGVHGKGGGYRLTKKPEEYRLIDILKVTDSLAPVECLDCEVNTCERKENCPTLPLWTEFGEVIEEFFSSKTLSDLI